jgi:DNA (cytosine-5)-methyltransferase 1
MVRPFCRARDSQTAAAFTRSRLRDFVAEAIRSGWLPLSEPPRRCDSIAPTVIDLFAGAGGLTHGFVRAGFRPVWANDSDLACVRSYNENFGAHAVDGSLEDLLASDEGRRLPHADVVIGGPPCQGFSLLNKNRDADDRKGLWRAYWEVVRRVSPSVFVMENVPELLPSTEYSAFRRRASAEGFAVVEAILNSADFGVPQTRKRAIVIGSRIGHIGLPVPTHAKAPESNRSGLRPWTTVRDAIGDLPAPVGTEPRVGIVAPPLDLHFGRIPTPTSLERYAAVPAGGNRFDLLLRRPDLTPRCWKQKKTGGTDIFGRLWWNRPSVTIRTEFFKPEKGRYLHPVANRPITHREAARIQTFPDDFRFVGTKIEIARQIGNAVPCLLAYAIAVGIKVSLSSMGTRSSTNDGARGREN